MLAIDAQAKAKLIAALEQGARRTYSLIGQMTEYHGGPVRTEYMLTTDVARALVDGGYEVSVECLNRDLLGWDTRDRQKLLRSKRTDIAVMNGEEPVALVELKIGVSKLRAIKVDLDKIGTTIGLMPAATAARVMGVSLFQVHVGGHDKRWRMEAIAARSDAILARLRTDLSVYARDHSNLSFELKTLSAGGEADRDLEPDGDGLAWGTHGHRTTFHVVTIESRRPAEPVPTPFAELRERSSWSTSPGSKESLASD